MPLAVVGGVSFALTFDDLLTTLPPALPAPLALLALPVLPEVVVLGDPPLVACVIDKGDLLVPLPPPLPLPPLSLSVLSVVSVVDVACEVTDDDDDDDDGLSKNDSRPRPTNAPVNLLNACPTGPSSSTSTYPSISKEHTGQWK